MTAAVPNAEQAYVGALLWLPARAAVDASCLVEADDFAGYHLRLIHGIVVQLADVGVAPDPAAVLIAAQNTGVATGADSIRSLALTLAELFDHRATVPASVRYYAAGVLADKVRRRTVEASVRVAQAADSMTLDDLAELQAQETEAVELVKSRLGALMQPSRRLELAA